MDYWCDYVSHIGSNEEDADADQYIDVRNALRKYNCLFEMCPFIDY